MTLTPFQVDLIKGDLRQNGIELRDLQDDLVDHICCILESENQNERPFEEVYQAAKSDYFSEGFREIQEETTTLITQKYNNMKKAMNIIGLSSSVLLLLGSILKTMGTAPANELILFGAIGLTLGYLPLLLKIALKQTDLFIGKFRSISGFIGAELFIIGILLQVLHYYAGKEILYTGLAIVIMIFIPLLIKSTGTEFIAKLQPASLAVLLLAVASTFFAFSNKKASSHYLGQLVMVHENLDRTVDNNLHRLTALREDHEITPISVKTQDIISYVDKLKEHILNSIDPEDSSHSLTPEILLMYNIFISDIMVHNQKNHPYNGQELLQKLTELITLIEDNGDLSSESILGTETQDSWLTDNFQNKTLYSVYSRLTQLQLDLSTLELEYLNQ